MTRVGQEGHAANPHRGPVCDDRPPVQERPGHETGKGKGINFADLDDSLEAAHERMRRILAIGTARIEINATSGAGGLTTDDIERLDKMSRIWRTLTTNEPPPDLDGLTDEEIKAKLAGVKARKDKR